MTRSTIHRTRPALLLAACLLLAGCGGDSSPPTVDAWATEWRMVEEVPTVDQLVASDDRAATCDDALAAVREARGGSLQTTPNDRIETAFDRWASAAETYLFDCPTASDDDLDSFAADVADAREAVNALIDS